MTADLSTHTAHNDALAGQRAAAPSDVDLRLIRRGRPRSVPGEEAYLRSELVQAAIDIAAGR